MSKSEVTAAVERANRRLAQLRHAARSENEAGPVVETVLAEFDRSLQELKSADEEIARLGVELAEAHADTEFERERYRELFTGAAFALVVTDLRGVIIEANRAALDLFGTSPPLLAGGSLVNVVAPVDRDRFISWVTSLREASADGSVCRECGGSDSFQVESASRAPMTCEIIAEPLASRSGRIASIRWSLHDVTDRERAKAAAKLTDDVRRRDEFLATLGHELRNPLSAITLAADILTGDQPDRARTRWAAEVVQRHADHLQRLVADLLDVSRVERGKVTLHVEEVDLRDVATIAIESCQHLLESKDHELSLSFPQGPVAITGDALRLRQVMINLIDNAAKYTPSGGRIEVQLIADDKSASISVCDNGIGIPSDMLDRIFSTYEQIDGASERTGHGLGLGLALVRQLVELHGGTVHAASAGAGQGSTFVVQLPAEVGDRATPDAPDAMTTTDVTGKPHRILLVDDNADAADLLAEALRQLGYTVDVAYDGKSGLATARTTQYGAAMLDLSLPDMDGLEVCRALKTEQPELRLVALTGYSDPRSRHEAIGAGFDRFLTKPLHLREVASTLEELEPPAK